MGSTAAEAAQLLTQLHQRERELAHVHQEAEAANRALEASQQELVELRRVAVVAVRRAEVDRVRCVRNACRVLMPDVCPASMWTPYVRVFGCSC